MNNGLSTNDKIAILDAGAQYAKVIDRRVRELNVLTEILPLQKTTPSILKAGKYSAIIISGGPASVNDENQAPFYHPEILEMGLPILGICYGMQLLNTHHGGSVARLAVREDGQFGITLDTSSPIFSGLSAQENVLLTHGDSVKELAPSFKVIARSSSDLVAAISNESLKQYGVQFHPEVDLTDHGKEMFTNFLFKIANCKPTYTMESRKEGCIRHIRETVGNKKVVMLVSGGVDSTVCAALLREALSEAQLIVVHVNNGFMRLKESEQVVEIYRKLDIKLTVLNSWSDFYNGTTWMVPNGPTDHPLPPRETPVLCHVTEPEEKRKIIGDTFMRIADAFIKQNNLKPKDVLLGQGTLRPDLIESASSLVSTNANTIKTHHNDTNLVRELRAAGRVVEPLKDFHKDEVRKIGDDLNLPKEFTERHPFPGPGLAIRILCANHPFVDTDFNETQVVLKVLTEYASSVRKEHAFIPRVDDALSNAEKNQLSNMNELFHASLLPIRSVGVQGDGRTFSYVVGLSCCRTDLQSDFQWTQAFELAKIIPKVCHNINRVCLIFGSPTKQQITEITPTTLTPHVIELLQVCDSIANKVLAKHSATTKLSQMPVVLIPVDFDRDSITRNSPSCRRSIVLRPFLTHDFMTGRAAVPGKDISIHIIEEMVSQIAKVNGISRVLYDLSNKPPGTTEWE